MDSFWRHDRVGLLHAMLDARDHDTDLEVDRRVGG
jgi:hypothetical protein